MSYGLGRVPAPANEKGESERIKQITVINFILELLLRTVPVVKTNANHERVLQIPSIYTVYTNRYQVRYPTKRYCQSGDKSNRFP